MKQRLFYLDWLRVFATIMVVTIHASAWIVATKLDSIPASNWLTANLFESIARPSVPLFVMISGALLLGDTRVLGYKAFLQKRISKIFIPLLGWSFIYYSYLIYRGDYFGSFSISQFLKLFVTNGISTHLWFMYMILGIYLTVPLVKVFIRNATKKDIHYFLLLWLFASVAVKFMKFYIGFGPNIELFYVTNYVGYFVLGYYLANFPLAGRVKLISSLAAFAGVSATFLLTYYSTKNAGGTIQEFWYEYYSPNVLLAAVGMFIFFMVTMTKLKELPFIFKMISKNSFGIYLVHILVMQVFSNEIFNPIWDKLHPALAIPINVSIVIFLSGLCSYILSKIPILKKLAP